MGGDIQLFWKPLGDFLGFSSVCLPDAPFQHPEEPGSQPALPRGSPGCGSRRPRSFASFPVIPQSPDSHPRLKSRVLRKRRWTLWFAAVLENSQLQRKRQKRVLRAEARGRTQPRGAAGLERACCRSLHQTVTCTEQALRENQCLLRPLSKHRFSQFVQSDGPKSDLILGEPKLLVIRLSMDLGTRSCPAGKVPAAACAMAEEAEALGFPEGTAARQRANLGNALRTP